MKYTKYILIAIIILAFSSQVGQAQTIQQLPGWVSTTSPATALTQQIFGRTVRITGLEGCIEASADGTLSSSTGLPCGSGGGGGGSSGGTWSTTTSQVAGRLINYSNNTNDVVAIGSTATTTAEWWYDPTALIGFLSGKFGIGTTSPYRSLSVNGNAVVNDNVLSSYFVASSTSASSIFPLANITKLSNLTSNGFVKTSGGDGTLSVDTATYESGLTAGDGLTRTVNDFDCDTASGSVFGCLASADWTTFNNKQAAITAGDTQVLFADGANNPAGDAGFTYNKTSNDLTVAGNVGSASITSNQIDLYNNGFITFYSDAGLTERGRVNATATGVYDFDSGAGSIKGSFDFTGVTASTKTLTVPNTSGTIALGTGTSNEIVYWSGTNTLGTLAVATYPSLTELAYVKGVTSDIQGQFTGKQDTDTTLTALAAYNTNGILTQTAADTFTGRTITGTADEITVTNGDGVSGNPTLSLPADVLIPTVLTVPNTGLHLLDTNATHDLIVAPGSNLTADRTLTVTTGDTNMIVDLTAVTDEYVLAYDTGTNAWRGVVSTGGGGSSAGGTWSTTTSTVSGQLINYPNNATDIVAIGSSATTSAEIWFDPNISKGVIPYASTTMITAELASSTRYLASQVPGAVPAYSFSSDPDTGFGQSIASFTSFISDGSTTFFIGPNIQGTATGAILMEDGAGTVSTPAYTFRGDTNLGLYRIGEDILGITSGGTSVLRVGTASTSVAVGNFGVGTTSPNWKLSVAGIGSFDDYVRASYFTATSSTASTFPYASTTMISATTASTTNLVVSGISGSTQCLRASATGVVSGTGSDCGSGGGGGLGWASTTSPNSNSIFSTALSNVGIGTTSPYAKLSVVGETVSTYFTATSTTAASTFAGGLNVGASKVSIASTGVVSLVGGSIIDPTYGSGDDLRIYVPDIMYLQTNGAGGGFRFNDALFAQGSLGLNFSDGNHHIRSTANHMYFGEWAGGFHWSNTNTSAEVMTLTSGNLGIGVTSPTALLHLKAGTATANTAPIKFTSGTLTTAAVAGQMEFLTDDYYLTRTTGPTRAKVVTTTTGRATAQTAANASVATYTLGAEDASFIVSSNVLVTTSSAEAFTVTVDYTDEGNTARVITLNFQLLGGVMGTAINFANGAVPYEGIPIHIRAKASTAITIKTAAGGTYTGATYNVEGVITKI